MWTGLEAFSGGAIREIIYFIKYIIIPRTSKEKKTPTIKPWYVIDIVLTSKEM